MKTIIFLLFISILLYFIFLEKDIQIENFCLLSGILPLKVYNNLGGVYGLVNIYNPNKIKQYIGSSKDLYQRLMDHLKGRDSNIRLQRNISKYGIDNFQFVIYYWDLDPSVILTDIETEVIKSFSFESLYNFKKEANSSLGYKHTMVAIEKIKLRFKNKSNTEF